MRIMIVIFAVLLTVGCRSRREVVSTVDSVAVSVSERRIAIRDTVWQRLALRADTLTITLTDTVATVRAVGVTVDRRRASASRTVATRTDTVATAGHAEYSRVDTPRSHTPGFTLRIAAVAALFFALVLLIRLRRILK